VINRLNMLKQSVFVKVACFWILALVIGSFLPQQAKVALGTSTASGQAVVARVAWTHGIVHYAAFGSTTLLLIVIARKPWQRHTAFLATIVLGVGIELLQHFLYGSDIELTDVRDDAFAACAAYLIWRLLQLWPAKRAGVTLQDQRSG
jgi:VanZ family protein